MADTMNATPRKLGCRMHAPRQAQGRHIPDDRASKQTAAPAITPWHLHYDLSIEVDETSRLRMGLDLLPADKHRRSTTINHDRTRVEVWTMEDKPRRMEEW
jgi:predicted  nucleic acid-binding Zn ribbon protein